MSVNITDVARAAGVSTSTASRALRNYPTLSAFTIARVRACADKLGYRPNPLVRSLMAQVRARQVEDRGACLAYIDMSPTRDFWRDYAVTRAFHAGASARAEALGFGLEHIQPVVEGLSRARLTSMLKARGIRGVLLPVHVEHEPECLRLDDFPVDLAEFAVVALGGEYASPAAHFASNNQFMGGRRARQELRRLGYTRPGLVIEPKVHLATDGRFESGFYSLDWPRVDMPVPVLFARPGDEAVFAEWYRRHRPDCVVANFPYVHEWMLRLGLSVPGECAFAGLDWDEQRSDLAGLDQRSAAVASAAVDLISGQLNRNEFGLPEVAHGLFIDGVWRDGSSAPARGVAGGCGRDRSRAPAAAAAA